MLTPDLRACGDSEGDFVGMVWLDRKDVLNWIDWITERDPDAQIVLYEISMGAATTMMTAGENTPDQVTVFIEDCGYTKAIPSMKPPHCSRSLPVKKQCFLSMEPLMILFHTV